MEYSQWNGFKQAEFEFQGRRATLVFPKEANKGRNWSIKTEYKDPFPETEIALLEKGFHVAYLKNVSRLAPKEDCDAKAEFAKFLSKEYNLSKKMRSDRNELRRCARSKICGLLSGAN